MTTPGIPPTRKQGIKPTGKEEPTPPREPEKETPSPPKDFKKKYPPAKPSSRMWASAPSKATAKTLGEETTTIQKNPQGQIIYWKGKLALPLPNANPTTFSQQELQAALAQFLITNRDLLDFYGVQKPPLLLAKKPDTFGKVDGGQMYVVRFFQYCPISESEAIPIDGGDLVVSGSLNVDVKKASVEGTIESIGGVYYSCPPKEFLAVMKKKDRVLLVDEMKKKLEQEYRQKHPDETLDKNEVNFLGFSLIDNAGKWRLVYGANIKGEPQFVDVNEGK